MTFRRRLAAKCKFQMPDHQKNDRHKFFDHGATDCISQVSRHQETGYMRVESAVNFSKKVFLVTPLSFHPSDPPLPTRNVVVDQSVVEPNEKTLDLRVSSNKESTDILVFAEGSKRSNTSKPTGRHIVLTHFSKDPDCGLTKTTRAPCSNRPDARGDRVHHPQKFGDAVKADHEVLNDENDSRLQHRCAGFFYSFRIQSYPTQSKTAQETINCLQKFVPPVFFSHTETSQLRIEQQTVGIAETQT